MSESKSKCDLWGKYGHRKEGFWNNKPKKKNESDTPKVDAQTEAKLKEMRRDATPMKDYYKAWDKLATAIDEEAEQEEIDTDKI